MLRENIKVSFARGIKICERSSTACSKVQQMCLTQKTNDASVTTGYRTIFNNWKGRITRKANLDGVIANRSLTFSTRLEFYFRVDKPAVFTEVAHYSSFYITHNITQQSN